MKDTGRKEDARLKAEAYAPAPRDSRLLYGLIAASLLLLGVAAVDGFYATDLWRYPLGVAALAVAAFGLGLVVRRRRMQRHRRAHRQEYDGMGAGGTAPDRHLADASD